MGHINQAIYLGRHVLRENVRKVVEIGSKDYGSTVEWRHLFQCEYIGVDMEPGKGVDVVCDITQSSEGLPTDADLLICCSVLEHVKRPWEAAPRLEGCLRPGGVMYVSVPWVQRYHGYPDDYWRMTHSAIRELFPAIEWADHTYSTNVKGEFVAVTPGADNDLALEVEGRKHLPYLELHSVGVRR